ncbi:hypothetical protein TNCT_245251 [Trichonephila clavata]|uniref:Uncharacterized protein n=1 Tax=Trichonephila clavata TaxID=2740835 RepID=A0A8X6HZC3_TRICU|nr:hypothetical protein TNCT_245251 [Trichonephila clavata]
MHHDLLLPALRNHEATLRDLVLDLQAATGTINFIAAQKINEFGLYVGKPMICFPFFQAVRGARLNWCHSHAQGSQEDLSRVLLTEEFRCNLNTASVECLATCKKL